MTILKDPVRPFDPFPQLDVIEIESSRQEPSPEPRGTSLVGDLRSHVPLGRTSFEVASRGGYVRTVTGTVAYLDEEAETYMVRRGDGNGELLRVPLRDITSAHEAATGSPLDPGDDARDAEGLGTG
jgi:hypothetical protein